MASELGHLESLEAKAPILFLVGGALYAVFVAHKVLLTYAGTSFTLANALAWLTWVIVSLGLLGLYPALVERRPYLTRAAAVVAVIPALCSAIVTVGKIFKAAGMFSEPSGPLGLIPFVAIVTFTLSMLLFGVTTLLADVHPKPVGVLMLVSASVFPLFMTVLSGLPDFVGNGLSLVAYLGIGVVLQMAGVPTDGVEPPADTAA